MHKESSPIAPAFSAVVFSSTPATGMPVQLAVQIDQICDRFEEAWLGDTRPDLKHFLEAVPSTAQPNLFHELLRVELEQRLRRGEHPGLPEYESRFPEQLPLIRDLMQRLASTATPSVLPTIPGYQLLQVLGQGGMGIVYLARQSRLNRLVALKMILAGSYAGEKERARFATEAEAVARLQHPNIVRIYEVGEHEGHPFLSLEYVEGTTLSERLRGTPLPARDAAALLEVLACAVHSAHVEGVVHRDLKPANILLVATRDSESPASDSAPVPKITDFGLAKQLDDDDQHTGSGAILGTPSYMAPEQAAGLTREVGPAADIYALGAILFECLTGRPPFKGPSVLDTLEQVRRQEPIPPRRLAPKVPRDLETICLKCLQKEPRRRYSSAWLLAEDLQAFLDGRAIKARPTTIWEQAGRWALRHPGVAALATLTVLTVLTAAGLVTWKWREAVLSGRDAEAQRRRAEQLLTRFSFDRGLALCEAGDVGRGLLWLAHTLKMVPTDAELAHGVRANLAAWQTRLHTLSQVLPHDQALDTALFSPDGKRVVTVCTDRQVRIWSADQGTLQGPPLLHPAEIQAIAFSPDSKWLATACADGQARVWRLENGQPIPRPLQHAGPVTSLTFIPSKALLVTGSQDRGLRLWNVETGEIVARADHMEVVQTVAASPDGLSILSGSADGTARMWDTTNLKPVGPGLLSPAGPVREVAYGLGGRVLLTLSRDRKKSGETVLEFWDPKTGRGLRTLRYPQWVRAVAFAPTADQRRVLIGSDDHTARLWDVDSGNEVIRPLAHQENIRAVAFSPDGKWILTGSDDRTARLWEADTGRPVGQLLEHTGAVRSVTFSPDGQKMLTASSDGTARLWSLAAARSQGSEFWHEAEVMAVALSPDGKTLVTGTDNDLAYLWETETGKRLQQLKGHKDDVLAVAFSPDGKHVLTGSRDRTVRVWEAATGQCVREWRHLYPIRSLAMHPQGNLVLIGGGDSKTGGASLWDLSSPDAEGKPLPIQEPVWQVAFAPDGQRCAIASGERTAELWQLSTMQRLTPALTHQGRVVALAFSPDGRKLITGSADKTALVWDTQSGVPLSSPLPHQGSVWGVAFGRDGQSVITACGGGYARVWDLATGIPIGPAWQHLEAVWGICHHAQEPIYITASADKTARLWRLPEPLQGEPAQIERWIQSLTGLELDENGATQWLTPELWRERR